MVTYAVKSNPEAVVITNLAAAGVTGFDVASPSEIKRVREFAPMADLHYNNPVRSRSEILYAQQMGVRSYSVDGFGEFHKLRNVIAPEGVEISVRFKLPVAGAAYDFGAKFGADPAKAVDLLKEAKSAGYVPSLTFHPGTQCEDPNAWESYIIQAAEIARSAGISIRRLNVGGGFPCKMMDESLDLEAFFDLIEKTVASEFGGNRPALVCEPGRSMVAESFALATRIKSISDEGSVFLNDGIYGGLSEFPSMGVTRKFTVISPQGLARQGAKRPTTLFGPTCDSLDTLPNQTLLPEDTEEEDYILFTSMGAYVKGVTTEFNGYGTLETVTVVALES